MARYTSLFTVATSIDGIRDLLRGILESCSLDIIYDTGDYMVAREKPGRVSFAKLVTVEVLIDRSVVKEEEVRMNFVVKNEELPLQVDNHCHQIFAGLNQAITDNRSWQLIESVA